MDYENDDIQIHEFIESVESDLKYAGTEGYAQAMVEAVENYAIIEEFINEADGNKQEDTEKKGYWGGGDGEPKSFKNKEGMISKFFGAIYRFIKAAIAKVKGFFATLRRKLTVLITKGAQKISSFINRNVNLTEIGDSEFEVKDLNKDFMNKLEAFKSISDITNNKNIEKIMQGLKSKGLDIDGSLKFGVDNTTDTSNVEDDELDYFKELYSDAKEAYNDATSDLITNIKESLLAEDEVTLNGRNVKSFYDTYNKKLLKNVDKVYNALMKNFNKQIKQSQKNEKDLRKASHKGVTSGQLTRIKYAMKFCNLTTKTLVTMKYKIMQGIASACLAVYKSGLWAALKCLGARGAHAVKSATESTRVDLFDRIH